jgi:hypothetical protein
MSSNDEIRRSSVENYQRYYDEGDAGGRGESLADKSKRHYQEYLQSKNRNQEQARVNSLFEPQFLRDNKQRANVPRLVLPDRSSGDD